MQSTIQLNLVLKSTSGIPLFVDTAGKQDKHIGFEMKSDGVTELSNNTSRLHVAPAAFSKNG